MRRIIEGPEMNIVSHDVWKSFDLLLKKKGYELEQPFSSLLVHTPRGPYADCVGYFSFNGNLDTCITIRTALLKGGQAYVQAGGGWVNDSEPEAEFQETVNKSKAMLKAVALAETFGKMV